MSGEIEKAGKLDEKIARLESVLVEKRNLREMHSTNVWDNMKRVRSAAPA